VVAELYKQGTGGRQLATLTTSVSNLTDYAERMAWLDLTTRARTSSFERYAAVRDRLEADGQVLRAVRLQAAEANAVAQRSCEETGRQVEAQEGRIEELAAEVERLEAEARARAERREAVQEQDEGTSGGGGSSQPATPAASSAPAPAAAASGSGGAAVQFALAQVGKPYAWGGSGPDSYDCSGLTSAAWAAAGVSLPHNSGMQYSATTRVSRDALQPGDLMFFGSPIHHVAMYMGNGQMVEAPRSGLTVRVVSTDRSDYVGAGRP
jgi:cell wall-associated NlpC family hydrolase